MPGRRRERDDGGGPRDRRPLRDALFEQVFRHDYGRLVALLVRRVGLEHLALVEDAMAPSPVHTLNRAVAVAEWRGPEAGLSVLDDLEPPAWLAGSYLWDAVLADLHRRAGHGDEATQHRDRALEAAPTEAIRTALRRRLCAGPTTED